jgi:large subunit ribosomal protein L35
MGIFPAKAQREPKIPVAEFSQVCYTLLACGVSSRNRLLCALDGATVVDCAEVQSINHHPNCLSHLYALRLNRQNCRILHTIEIARLVSQQVKHCTLPRRNRKTERRVMKQKVKTHKAMAKRVKITGSGKIMRRKVASSHLRRNKSPHSVRSMDKNFPLSSADSRRMKRLLPYSF